MSLIARGLLVASLSLACVASAQADFAVHLSGLEGPLPRRDLARAVPHARLRECQSTLMGGPIRLRVRVSMEGLVVIDRATAPNGEEILGYVPCIARVLGLLRLGPQEAETHARITLVYPAYGIARPSP